ncbi:MAG: RecX family transcriptional regulator [Chloroflexi bacterium]|nr:RecX family transcriptional regulator [Chloroflexota bacterium]
MQQGVITALEVQKRNKDRVSVFLDEAYAFSLSLAAAARLHKGQTLTPSEIETLRGDDDVVRATDRAARYLSYRPRSRHEVRTYLIDKEFADPVVEAALAKLERLGYLDDVAFARFWVEQRTMFKPLGPHALRYELRQKGIANAIIDEALAAVDAESAAYQAAASRLQRLRGTDRRTFEAKIGAYLQRRGFRYDVIRTTLAQLIEMLEAEDPAFFTAEDETPQYDQDDT